MKFRVFDPKGSQIGWYEFDGDSYPYDSSRYLPAMFDIRSPYQWSFTSHQMASKPEFMIDAVVSLPHTDPRFTTLSVRSVAIKEPK